jgi:GNAT superfamily N-acetyltransferase
MIFDHPPSPPIFGTYYYLMKRNRISQAEKEFLDKNMFGLRDAIVSVFVPGPTTSFNRYNWAMAKVDVRPISEDLTSGALIEAYIMGSPGHSTKLLSRMEPRIEHGRVKLDTKADIRVDEDFQGWGGGRFMMSHAIRWAKAYHNERRIEGLYLKDEDRKALLIFYEPFGLKWEKEIARGSPVPVDDLIENAEGTYYLSSKRLLDETWRAMHRMHYLVTESPTKSRQPWLKRFCQWIFSRVSA